VTVSAQTPINRSTANGVTTVFPYNFKVLAAADLEVSLDGVVKTLTTDYTLSGVGDDAGGNVTMLSAPANGVTVVRRRNMAYIREVDYQDQGELPTDTLDDDQDAPILMIQQVAEGLSRAVSLPPESTGVSLTLPTPAALQYLRWNAAADALESVLLADVSLISLTAYAQTLLNAVDAAAARLVLGITTFGSSLVTAANAAAARTAMGAAASGANEDITSLSIQGAHKNLRSSAPGTSASITITADEICLESSTNTYQTLRSVSLTLVCSGSGANGLDTGSLAGSTIYHKWVIYNPATATTAALLSLSATAPTMPSGYTYKARVGAISTDGSGNKYPLGHTSFGADTDLIVKAATNVTNRPQLVSGVQGNASTPTYVTASMSAYVPSTACRVRGNAGAGGGASTGMMLAPNDQYGGCNSTSNPPPLALNTTSSSASIPFDFAIESTNLYYACNTANGYACLGGWRDTI